MASHPTRRCREAQGKRLIWKPVLLFPEKRPVEQQPANYLPDKRAVDVVKRSKIAVDNV
jgi:hypothetical protein